MSRVGTDQCGDPRHKFLCLLRSVAVVLRFVGNERVVLPDRHAVLAPVSSQRPARKRFAGIPFALAVVQQRAGRELFPQPFDEFARENPLLVRNRGEIPFRAIGIVNGNERRLAAHREAHVVFSQVHVNGMAERFDARPLLVGVRLGDARRFVNARHAHLEFEIALALVHAAADWRGAARVGRAGERNVAFAREQAGSRIEADPAAAGQIHLAPRVKIGEILFRAARSVERLHVGLELDQVAADKARRQAAMAEQLAEQPGGVAARTAQLRERFLRRLHAGFEADGVFDVLPKPLVDGNQKIIRARFVLFREFEPFFLRPAFDFAQHVTADGR